MFSSRTRWNRTQNRLARLVAERRRSGAPLFDLTLSNPTQAGLVAPADVLALLGAPSAAHYEPQPRGLGPARDAVAADYARRGLAMASDRLVLTASTSEAYAWLFKLLCDPGDAVLVPHPSYPLFEFLATLESVETIPYALAYDGVWHLDIGTLETVVTPRSRAIVVVNPHNPTGSCLRRDEADKLLAFAASHDLAVISDEVFADFLFQPVSHLVTSLASDGPALTFSLGGLSKSCGLPQLKLGWIAVTGPDEARAEALARVEIVADTYLSVSTPVQHAAPALLRRLPELQAPILARLLANRRSLEATIGPESAATLLPADGGWSAVVRVPATESEEERVCALLERQGVLVHPGYFFDFDGGAFLVLSLLPEPELFAEGVLRVLEGF